LKKDVLLKNNEMMTVGDTCTFNIYNLAVGYSIINTLHWRITPFCGGGFSRFKVIHSDNYSSAKIQPTPILGINCTYRFLTKNHCLGNSGGSSAFGISMKLTYAPWAVKKQEIPLSGGLLLLTMGVNLEVFSCN
jgi:hypothetical protein